MKGRGATKQAPEDQKEKANSCPSQNTRKTVRFSYSNDISFVHVRLKKANSRPSQHTRKTVRFSCSSNDISFVHVRLTKQGTKFRRPPH